jgi:Domain of unknown function (DUF4158)
VRFLGTFLADPTDVPPGVVTSVSRQLRVDPTCLPQYMERPPTHRDHAREIQRRYGYQDFHTQPEYFRLVRWLYLRAWVSDERPSMLFDLATARLVERKIPHSIEFLRNNRLRVDTRLPLRLCLCFGTRGSPMTNEEERRRLPGDYAARAIVTV